MSLSFHARTGLDRIRTGGLSLPGRGRCALVCNTASVDSDLRPAPEILHGLESIQLDRLFSPQHGFSGEKQDNMIESDHSVHEPTGLPIWSLYGEVREPTAEMMADLDAVLFDVPDVGTRVYTFLITLLHVMQAAARANVAVVVLDRPNPIGPRIDGPILESQFRSFVGLAPVPLQHGLTAGEYARFGRAALGIDVDLHVIEVEGWRRTEFFDETGLPWVLPSPNMPTLETALVYPGGVMLEGTNLSEGRGTTRPFELFGAPWIDCREVVQEIDDESLRGCALRPVAFEPTFHKFTGQVVHGFQIHILNRNIFRPIRTYAAIFSAIRQVHGKDFAWREPPYEYEHEKLPIDLIAGTARMREVIDHGMPMDLVSQEWNRATSDFWEDVQPSLLYA